MRYINTRSTYLLTYFLTSTILMPQNPFTQSFATDIVAGVVG